MHHNNEYTGIAITATPPTYTYHGIADKTAQIVVIAADITLTIDSHSLVIPKYTIAVPITIAVIAAITYDPYSTTLFSTSALFLIVHFSNDLSLISVMVHLPAGVLLFYHNNENPQYTIGIF